MKNILLTLMVFGIVACSQEPVVVPFDSTVEREGIRYQVNSQEPFTGVTGSYFENGQLKERANYKAGKVINYLSTRTF